MKAPKQNAGFAVAHQLIDEDALEYELSDFDKILTAVQ
jgi:hypothetical protein